MIASASEILIAVQLADSAFPSGAYTFSWGLEGVTVDGLLTSKAELAEIVEEQVTMRWSPMDRVFLTRAHAAPDAEALLEIDQQVEAMALSAPMRHGSRRAGRRLLSAFVDRGFMQADAYYDMTRRIGMAGHLPVVQGLVFREAGLSVETATLVSGWMTASGLVSAAVRLDIIGYRDAQEILNRTRAAIVDIVATPPRADAVPWSFTPLMDIALARGATRDGRMFTT